MKTLPENAKRAHVGGEANDQTEVNQEQVIAPTRNNWAGLKSASRVGVLMYFVLVCGFLSATKINAQSNGQQQLVELFEADIQTDNEDFLTFQKPADQAAVQKELEFECIKMGFVPSVTWLTANGRPSLQLVSD